MNRRWVLILILSVAISGCTGTNTDSEQVIVPMNATPTPMQTTEKTFPVTEPLTVYVNIKGTMFNPPELNITNGTTVKWKNQDSGKYIVNVSGSRSPPLNKNEYWSYTFNKTGTYEYGCDLHTFMPHGRITVI
jgi:plastocyanin